MACPGRSDASRAGPGHPQLSNVSIRLVTRMVPFGVYQKGRKGISMKNRIMTKTAVAVAAAALAAAGLVAGITPPQPAHATTCGVWRWPVKTGSDASRFGVNRTVIHTSIRHLRSRTAPSSFPSYYQNHRFRGAERHIYQLRVRLTQFRVEDDGDIHLVIRNSAGKQMIAEIPRPVCVSNRSLWKSAIRSARSTFTNHYRVTTTWHHVNRWITLRGLGFFDEVHNVTGQAPNGIELHPVTRVRF
jgi:hypothetical protein